MGGVRAREGPSVARIASRVLDFTVAGVGQWYQRRPGVTPGENAPGNGGLPAAQMPGLGILAQQHGELDSRQLGQQRRTPGGGTLRARREIACLAGAWVAESHRQDGQQALVVELRPIYAQPFPQAVAAGIVEWDPGCVNLAAGRLADHQDACRRVQLQNRSRTQGQFGFAQGAGADFGQQLVAGRASGQGRFQSRGTVKPRISLPRSAVLRW